MTEIEIADAQPTTVDTLAEAVEAAIIHKFTLGTSMGPDHEVYHRFAVSTARRVMEVVAPVVARLQEEQEATQAAYDNAVRWHHAFVSALLAADQPIPEHAPDPAAYYLGANGTTWLYHLDGPDADEGHIVAEADAGTTLADLMKAVLAHRCDH